MNTALFVFLSFGRAYWIKLRCVTKNLKYLISDRELPCRNASYAEPFYMYVSLTEMLWSTGEDYQHIEFGVDEVMNAEPVAVKDSLYKVSSTLNPQAPEFILGCQQSQKALPTDTRSLISQMVQTSTPYAAATPRPQSWVTTRPVWTMGFRAA